MVITEQNIYIPLNSYLYRLGGDLVMRKEWIGAFAAVIAAVTILAAQYTSATIAYQYHIQAEKIVWFGAGDKSTDGIYVLRAVSNGSTPYLELGYLFAGINKTYTAAFAIVNEELVSLAITGITVTNTSGGEKVYIWLHKNASALAWNDGGVNASAISETNPYWLAAGDGNNTTVKDASGVLHGGLTYDAQSHTKPLDMTWIGSDGSSSTQADFVWVLVIIKVPSGTAAGDYTGGSIVITFKAST